MNSLGIVSRVCLMEAAQKKEQESPYRKWGRRAAIGAGVAGAGLVGARAIQSASNMYGKGAKAMAMGAYRGAKHAVAHPINATKAVGRGVSRAMRSGYARAAQFADAHAPNVLRYPAHGISAGLRQGQGKMDKMGKAAKWGYEGLKGAVGEIPKTFIAPGLAAAGAYGGYIAHQNYAKKKAREAYIHTYMSLMEAAEAQEPESGVKKWGKRAAAGLGVAAGAYGAHRLLRSKQFGSSRYRNMLANYKKTGALKLGQGRAAKSAGKFGGAWGDLKPVESAC